MSQEIFIVLQWWFVWLVAGVIGFPLSQRFFGDWEDQGYFLAKVTGLVGITYIVWVLGMVKLAPFSEITIGIAAMVVLIVGWNKKQRWKFKTILGGELFFLAILLGWSFVKAHEPSINGLEKFMDFGFTKSILRSEFFPPADMWFAGESINYYYFGHLMLAVMTKISGLDLVYTFNLMLATIAALCATMSFSIGKRLLVFLPTAKKIMGALLIAYLVTFSGNLHTIYSFTTGYSGREDNPPPFWNILVNPFKLEELKMGWNSYWYPNATRFIPYTIHEFPSYSFVVSDIHGHVLDIPLALLAIAMLVNMFGVKRPRIFWFEWLGYGVLAGLMFMTNALDGPIYLGLLFVVMALRNFRLPITNLQSILNLQILRQLLINYSLVIVAFVITTAPFLLTFKSFVSGVAINCPPAILADSKIGPIIFEGVEKCQKSPVWMMLILWGFFIYAGIGLFRKGMGQQDEENRQLLRIIAVVSLGLVIFPEFFYFKDIYPMHFRSNTMFKLGYQVFILMSIGGGYAMVMALREWRKYKLFLLGLIPLVALVVIYPLFSVKSYFGQISLNNYKGLNGTSWMEEQMPEDGALIEWLNTEIPKVSQPVVLEANGDSYTTANRISAFTGLPTVAGWTVHEWLWRGGYESIDGRSKEVKSFYESGDLKQMNEFLNKYQIKYVVVGNQERERYPNINESALMQIGKVVFDQGRTKLYQVN